MHGETQCKLLLWNACFWHDFTTGVVQFTKQYGVMLTTSVFTNSLVPLYSRQGFWFWQLFRCSSFLPNKILHLLFFTLLEKILFYPKPNGPLGGYVTYKRKYLLPNWIWWKVLVKCLASLHLIHQKKDFILAVTEKCESMNCDFK